MTFCASAWKEKWKRRIRLVSFLSNNFNSKLEWHRHIYRHRHWTNQREHYWFMAFKLKDGLQDIIKLITEKVRLTSCTLVCSRSSISMQCCLTKEVVISSKGIMHHSNWTRIASSKRNSQFFLRQRHDSWWGLVLHNTSRGCMSDHVAFSRLWRQEKKRSTL